MHCEAVRADEASKHTAMPTPEVEARVAHVVAQKENGVASLPADPPATLARAAEKVANAGGGNY